MKVVIDIDEKTYNVIKGFGDIPIGNTYEVAMAIINGEPLPKGQCLIITERATNGDVIKGAFPNFEEDISIVGDTILLERYTPYCKMQFHKDWWNAPYKAEKEEI